MGIEMKSGTRLAIHACCGPCLLEPYDALSSASNEAVVVFFNPNIQPPDEYERRLVTLMSYAERVGIQVVVLAYDPDEWSRAVADASTRTERCRACYALRLGAVARWAAENRYDAIATTLTVSPYQDAAAIADAGRRAAEAAGVEYVESDFRDRYRLATTRARELGMYRQNYCGCLPSRVEAEADREARKRERSARS